MVHSDHHRRSLAETINQIEVPQRPVAVEWHRHEIAHEPLQRGAVTRSGQTATVHVVLEREVGIVLPLRRSQWRTALHHPLAKARIPVDQTHLDDLPDALPIDRLVE